MPIFESNYDVIIEYFHIKQYEFVQYLYLCSEKQNYLFHNLNYS